MGILSIFIGNSGEKIFISYLQKNGYQIIAHQYKKSFVEIDVIAEKDSNLYIFEVKTSLKKQTASNKISATERENVSQCNYFSIKDRVGVKKLYKLRRFSEYYYNQNSHFSGVYVGIAYVSCDENQNKPNIDIIWI